jgi:hypothetical protein
MLSSITVPARNWNTVRAKYRNSTWNTVESGASVKLARRRTVRSGWRTTSSSGRPEGSTR